MHLLPLVAFVAVSTEAPGTVAVAIDTAGLPAAMAAEVREGAVAHIVSGLSQVMVARSATEVRLTAVTTPNTVDEVMACASSRCLQDLAHTAGLDLAVQVKVQPASARKPAGRVKSDYLITMVAVPPSPSRDEWTEQTECPGCGSAEIKHAASLLASLIAEHISLAPSRLASAGAIESSAPARAPSPPLPVSPIPSVVPPPQPALVGRPPPQPPRPSVSPYLSLAAVTGGAVVLGAGLYLLHIDGEGTCDAPGPGGLCARRYNTRVPGIALVAGGGVAALGGLVGLLLLSPGRAGTRVAFNPSAPSLVLSGGF